MKASVVLFVLLLSHQSHADSKLVCRATERFFTPDCKLSSNPQDFEADFNPNGVAFIGADGTVDPSVRLTASAHLGLKTLTVVVSRKDASGVLIEANSVRQLDAKALGKSDEFGSAALSIHLPNNDSRYCAETRTFDMICMTIDRHAPLTEAITRLLSGANK